MQFDAHGRVICRCQGLMKAEVLNDKKEAGYLELLFSCGECGNQMAALVRRQERRLEPISRPSRAISRARLKVA